MELSAILAEPWIGTGALRILTHPHPHSGVPVPALSVAGLSSGKILAVFLQSKMLLLEIKPQRWMYGQRLDDETSARKEILA